MDSLFAGAHFHLLVNHVPIIGAVFALSLLAASFLWAPDVLRRTAFVVLIGTAVAGMASDLSGDPAEQSIRGLPGVRRDDIHAHEAMADKAYIIGGILGLAALVGLVRWRRVPVPASGAVVMFLATAFLSGAMAYTGLLGGRIRHTEVRPGATKTDAAAVEAPRSRPPAPAPAPAP